tara:strand:- start:104 stop:367 length:264 start_codon:yes stop_codon:yes gene_type:complete
MKKSESKDVKGLLKLANKPPSKKWKTFDKWDSKGMVPVKGQKATFHGGKAYFHKRQVTGRYTPTGGYCIDEDSHCDEPWGWADMHGY